MSYINIGKEIIKTLQENGYEAYFVGGFVRDRILGNGSDDIDITTNATPDQVVECFKHVKHTGKKYGTVTVLYDQYKYEVTTYRFDGDYVDNRRPEEVTFSNNLEDDLSRRDFTINAIVMDEFEEVKDFHNGINDLNNQLIRTINDPVKRFNEDSLRILRAIRFVAKLGFDIEDNTLQAMSELRHLIKNIAIERVMVELDKIMKGEFRQKAYKYLVETKIHEELYGLKEGIEYLSKHKDELLPVEAFTVCFILGDMSDVWRFSNNNMKVMKRIMMLHEVTRDGEFNKYLVFSHGKDMCLATNRVSAYLGYKDQSQLINDIDNDLVVKDVCDLAFKGQDILQLTTLKTRSVIALVIDDLLYNVIMGIMPNEYNVLKEFALKRVEELQKDMER